MIANRTMIRSLTEIEPARIERAREFTRKLDEQAIERATRHATKLGDPDIERLAKRANSFETKRATLDGLTEFGIARLKEDWSTAAIAKHAFSRLDPATLKRAVPSLVGASKNRPPASHPLASTVVYAAAGQSPEITGA